MKRQLQIIIDDDNNRNLPPSPKKQSSPQLSMVNQQETQTNGEAETELDKDNGNRKRNKRKKSTLHLVANLIDTQYPVVKKVVKGMLGFKVIRDATGQDWDLYWTDNAVSSQQLSKLKPHQKINHFPGMYTLSRKNYLARNLTKMQKRFPDSYNFFPKTWVLPTELNQFRTYMQSDPNAVVIAKPEASSQGRGIFLTKSVDDFQYGQHYVVQKYLKKPFLIDGLKFDLRVYVLVAGCDPLRVYVFKEGLARFATQLYNQPKKENLNNLYMHLTNYAINKNSQKFEFNSSATEMNKGHKRSLTAILRKLTELGHSPQKIWQKIKDCIAKTIISAQPLLAHHYRSSQPTNYANNICFQILGFDIILDSNLNPQILQVNYTPSFTTDTPLDLQIKKNLIHDTLVLMNLTGKAKRQIINEKKKQMKERTLTGKNFYQRQMRQALIDKAQHARNVWETKNIGNFQRILPVFVDLPSKVQKQKDTQNKNLQITRHQKSKYTEQFEQELQEQYKEQFEQFEQSCPRQKSPRIKIPLPDQQILLYDEAYSPTSHTHNHPQPSALQLNLQQKYSKFLEYSVECYQANTGANIRRNNKVVKDNNNSSSVGQGLTIVSEENNYNMYTHVSSANGGMVHHQSNNNSTITYGNAKNQSTKINQESNVNNTMPQNSIKYTNTQNLEKIYKSKFRPMVYKKNNSHNNQLRGPDKRIIREAKETGKDSEKSALRTPNITNGQSCKQQKNIEGQNNKQQPPNITYKQKQKYAIGNSKQTSTMVQNPYKSSYHNSKNKTVNNTTSNTNANVEKDKISEKIKQLQRERRQAQKQRQLKQALSEKQAVKYLSTAKTKTRPKQDQQREAVRNMTQSNNRKTPSSLKKGLSTVYNITFQEKEKDRQASRNERIDRIQRELNKMI